MVLGVLKVLLFGCSITTETAQKLVPQPNKIRSHFTAAINISYVMNKSMEAITYKFIQTADLEEIVSLYAEADWWDEKRYSRKKIPDMIKGSFCFLLAYNGTKAIGMGRVISDGSSDGYIQDVVVAKKFRGQGIGKQLIQRLTAFCTEKGLEWIGLIAEPGPYHFIQSWDFKFKVITL